MSTQFKCRKGRIASFSFIIARSGPFRVLRKLTGAFGAHMKSEYEKWVAVIKADNIVVE
jgi:hypothetical protein